ncbi:MAG: hypothetical protein JNM63_04175 [Spirochaetia bacterium]|nr:hypothetical protein [Spirochaetia bacterium]
MPGIGISELIVIGIVLMVFINPKDWPKFIYHVGRIYSQLQGAYRQVTDRLKQIERDVRSQVELELDQEKEKSGDKKTEAKEPSPDPNDPSHDPYGDHGHYVHGAVAAAPNKVGKVSRGKKKNASSKSKGKKPGARKK